MAQAATKGMLSAVLSGVPGAQVAHVLKTREAGTQPNNFELETMRRSCQALLEVRPGRHILGLFMPCRGPRRGAWLRSWHCEQHMR